MLENAKILKTKKMSMYNTGRWISLLIGILYIGIGILLPIDPAEKYRGTEFYEQIAAHPLIPHMWRYIFVAIGFLSISWISSAISYVRTKSYEWEGLYQWACVLGYGGAIMLCLEWMREVFIMKVMTLYSTGNEMYRVACEVAAFPLDPDFLWMFGGFGFWYFITSLLALRNNMFQPKINKLGIFVGIDLMLTMFFGITDTIVYFSWGQLTIMQITALLGGILGAVYHVRMFFVMKKVKNQYEELLDDLVK